MKVNDKTVSYNLLIINLNKLHWPKVISTPNPHQLSSENIFIS